VIDASKLNKFFMDTALDRAKDAWWDPTNRCIMTHVDEEMAMILQMDQDLIFPTKKLLLTFLLQQPIWPLVFRRI